MDMKWRDAMAEWCIARVFSDDEKNASWPDGLEPEQLAVMQRPFLRNDREGKKRMEALRDRLVTTIEAGELEVDRATVIVREVDDERTRQNRQWARARQAASHATAWREVERLVYLVPPQAFAAWLVVHGMEPSQHIDAWLRARGAVKGGQEVDVPAAPAIAVQDVTDWPSLVRYRLQFADVAAQKRPAWLSAHVSLLAGALREECKKGYGRGALGRLATALGATRQALAGVLKKHQYNTTTGEAPQATATPFANLGARGTRAA